MEFTDKLKNNIISFFRLIFHRKSNNDLIKENENLLLLNKELNNKLNILKDEKLIAKVNDKEVWDNKIETIVALYSLAIINIMEKDKFDYNRFKKTALRINECITRLNLLALNYNQTKVIDKTIKEAIESWAKKESTPKNYKGVFK